MAAAVEERVRGVVAAYFERLNGDDWVGLSELFAEGAELVAPGTRPRRGRAEVGDYYRAALAPYPDHRDEPTRVVVAESTATVEIHYEGGLANGERLAFDAVDVFDIDGDGLIARLTSWYDSHAVRRRLAEARAADPPPAEDGPPRLGSVAEATPGRVLAALGLVRRGRSFRLDLPLHEPGTPLFGRELPEHSIFSLPGEELSEDDRLDNLNTQTSSHWDALRHFRAPAEGRYGGRAAEDLGIDLWAHGIVARGVLLDLGEGLGIDPGERREISPAELEDCAERQGVELRRGDALLLRTGWLAHFRALPSARRTSDPATPGLAPTAETVEWLRRRRLAALGSDNPGVEAIPGGPQGEMLHRWLLPDLGLALGELWWLDELRDDCARDGVWEGLLVAVPLNLIGGCGSPANAIFLK
jgi:kynurenine formamidase/ketosteroid isomerase-like protein